MQKRRGWSVLAFLIWLSLVCGLLVSDVLSADPPTATPSPLAHAEWIESDAPLVHPTGSWTVQTTASASGGSYLYSSGATTDALEFQFQGTQIEVMYLEHPDLGTFAIEIDTSSSALSLPPTNIPCSACGQLWII